MYQIIVPVKVHARFLVSPFTRSGDDLILLDIYARASIDTDEEARARNRRGSPLALVELLDISVLGRDECGHATSVKCESAGGQWCSRQVPFAIRSAT